MLAQLLLALAPLQTSAAQAEVLSYHLVLQVQPAQNSIEGRATLEIAARHGRLEELHFALNRALKLDGVQEGKRQLIPRSGVDIGVGRELAFRLVPALKKGERRTITFEYHGKGVDPGPQDRDWMGVLLVREDELRMSHASQWYPILPRGQQGHSKRIAPTTLELVLPPGMKSLGPGVLVSVEARGEFEVHRWVSEQAVRPSWVAGRFEEQIIEVGRQRVRVLSSEEHMPGAKRWGRVAADAIGTLGKLYGDLGERSYGLAEMRVSNRALFHSYEADGFSVYDGALLDGRTPDAHKIAHEVAHLFFSGAVDSEREGHGFLGESMAEAAALVFLAITDGEAAARDAAQLHIDRYFDNPGDELPVAASDGTSPRHDVVIRSKGALALRTLRAWAGPEEFDRALHGYLEECAAGRKIASLAALLGELRTSLGPLVDTWEQDWLRRPGAPEYSVEFETESIPGNRVLIKGKILQSGKLYHNPVELRLVSKIGRSITITVTPMDRSMIFQAVAPHDVVKIEINPRNLLLTGPGDVRCLDKE